MTRAWGSRPGACSPVEVSRRVLDGAESPEIRDGRDAGIEHLSYLGSVHRLLHERSTLAQHEVPESTEAAFERCGLDSACRDLPSVGRRHVGTEVSRLLGERLAEAGGGAIRACRLWGSS